MNNNNASNKKLNRGINKQANINRIAREKRGRW